MASELDHGTPASRRVDRRTLIKQLAAAGFAAPVITSILAAEAGAQGAATPAASPAAFVSPFKAVAPVDDPAEALKILGKDPSMTVRGGFNVGTPPALMQGLDLPTAAFFVRDHGPTMTLDNPVDYSLSVVGHIDTPLKLSLDDLRGMPQRTYDAFLECSGNSRGFYQPTASGTQWRNDAVGNAEWSGVPVREILAKAGIKDGAIDVVSQGGDIASMQRGLPIDTAMDADTIVALKMNGEDLPPAHGGPARLFVPGWGGIASTKWLIGLTVLDHAFQGDFNTSSYVIVDEQGQTLRPVREMPVKSVITSPEYNAQLPAGTVTIAGYAWSGLGGIVKVEVSTDNGASWNEATLTQTDGDLSWSRFEYAWDAKAGQTGLMARATDSRKTTQPYHPQWNAKGYQYNGIQQVLVIVK